jgi:cell wall-associated NlpC family hydrolase
MNRLVVPLNDAERAAFVAEARTYVRVPFRHTGRTRRGVDCVGLVAVALAEVGRPVADRRDYGRNPVRDGLRQVLVDHFGDPVDGEPRAGDVALMRWHEPDGIRLFNHVGIITDYPLGGVALLHAFHANGEVVEHRLAGPWPRRIVEVFRP